MSITIYYDGDCPFCQKYVTFTALSSVNPQLVNVREDSAARAAILSRDIDIDKGMVVVVYDRWFTGADAVNKLAEMSTPSGLFNKVLCFMLGSRLLGVL